MSERIIEAEVVEIIDGLHVVIDKGAIHDITKDDIFLIYSKGKEIVNPRTGESLGQLEIVHGEAEVLHIQDKITTLISNDITQDRTIVRKPARVAMSLFGNEITEETKGKPVINPFNNFPEIGKTYYARLIRTKY